MRVRGLGTDIVSVQRLGALMDRHGSRFAGRCFRSGELDRLGGDTPAAAAGWAAKEAFLKALGTRVTTIGYRDIEVVGPADGTPRLELHGRAREALGRNGATEAVLTLSRSGDFALATVILQSP